MSDAQLLPASGLILAGGTSRRMGREKLHLPWGGGTLLSHAVEVMTETVAEVLLVGYPREGVPAAPGLGLVVDTRRIGPVGGLLLGLESMTHEKAVVMAADMPFVDAASIRRLWDLSRGTSITVLRTSDGLHPLFGVYRRECLHALRSAVARGSHRVTGFWDGLSVHVEDVGDDPVWSRALQNVNSLEDYRRACAMASERPMSGHPS